MSRGKFLLVHIEHAHSEWDVTQVGYVPYISSPEEIDPQEGWSKLKPSNLVEQWGLS